MNIRITNFILTTLILFTIVTGCAATLTPRGQKVKYVTKEEASKDCKELGEVDFGALEGGVSMTDTKVRMRNKTAEMGGNFLVIDAIEKHVDGKRQWYTGSGRAYDCP